MAKLTVEEEHLSESYILLELARKVLEKDLAKINQSPLKLKDPYIRLLEKTLHHISKELYSIKVSMRSLGLKVQLNNHDDTFSEYTIFFRGYVLTAKYLNAHLKTLVSKQISGLFTQGGNEAREQPSR
ncbi:hypothetical protein SAMN05421736_11982 [Evansella caseinilytica]|uniref:Uncharacterized protein n=1 Tax=Evansella caseinilytica TaxID=1503961 RepID=A0A1H3UBP6_9BACI|nr:hypothetical protein [Evansella caseinilytica]SDZ59019.1 hypothetical protein SAMN05421736_11982 [Evansella caseinilytica]